MQLLPEDVVSKGMDIGDVLVGEALEKIITITNAGHSQIILGLHV